MNCWAGGNLPARIHFFVSLALVIFLFVHVAMVWRAGIQEPHASNDHWAEQCDREDANESNLAPQNDRNRTAASGRCIVL